VSAGCIRLAVREKLNRKGRRGELEAMKQGTLPTKLTLIVVAALLLFASPLPALAQSCALCYTQAASAGARMIQALRSGILVLIVPPTLMSIGMILIVYRNRNRCRDSEHSGIKP
jgi:hypothetical protein